jgi:hypothetical protein
MINNPTFQDTGDPESLSLQKIEQIQAFIKKRKLTDALSLLEGIGLHGNEATELLAQIAPVGEDA